MVGLLPSRPQRGRGGYSAEKLLADFDNEFHRYCVDIEQGRVTPEKGLQSFIIANAYQDERRLTVLRPSGGEHNHFASILFITDELAVFTEEGKVVCDLLALRREADQLVPVLIELKSSRQMARLIEQLDMYSRCIKDYTHPFERLYSEVLGEKIHFTGDPEKWLVWPGKCVGLDRREEELARHGIGVIQYQPVDKGYQFYVGRLPSGEPPRIKNR